MKGSVIVILLLGILLVLPLAQAQTQSQTYSGFNRFVDNVKLTFSGGDNKVRLALEIREKEVNSAIENFQNQNTEATTKNLEKANEKLQIVQEKVSLDTSEEIKISTNEIIDKINEEENLPDEFEDYILEEEKTQLTAELTEKTFEYCKELAKEDFALMLEEEECNPDTAIPGLEKELEELEDIQMKLFVELMLEIRSCIDDPGTCNCEVNVDVEQKAKCEKMVALAVRCEYTDDEVACDELESMKPVKEDGFAISFVPEFLRNLFREKDYMIEYDIEPSCGVPEECWDENDKPECEQYDHLKETNDDWDESGNFIGSKKGCGTKDRALTMRESIPECFDGDVFLEEKCGKITMVENEDGLINYLIGKEIDNIIEEFENKSRQYAPGTYANGIIEGNETWTIDTEKVREIKTGMDQITKQIKDITYAIGTGPGGDAGVVIDGDGQDVVTGDGGDNVVDNDVVGNGNGGYAPGTTTDGPPIDGSDGDCGEGVVCGGEDDVIDSPAGDNVIDNGVTLDDTDASDDTVDSSDE